MTKRYIVELEDGKSWVAVKDDFYPPWTGDKSDAEQYEKSEAEEVLAFYQEFHRRLFPSARVVEIKVEG